MITKYKIRTTFMSAEILEIKVTRETSASVFLPSSLRNKNERRESKISSLEEYHDTWELAHAALMKVSKNGVENVKIKLKAANKFHDDVMAMRNIKHD